jgi:hypothetical protein
MKTNFTYYRSDIEKWLYDNYQYFDAGDTPKEYAQNAVRYHNSESCIEHCQCYNENKELITPRLNPQHKKWFKEVIANLINNIWLHNTYIGIIKSGQGDWLRSHIETISEQ